MFVSAHEIGDMNQPSINRPEASLSDSALTTCATCGRPVWVYATPVGDRVSLEDLPGEFLIDGRGKAHRSTRPDGYRLHTPTASESPSHRSRARLRPASSSGSSGISDDSAECPRGGELVLSRLT
jgi:hypothetical protein